jgi:hypothetical protein
MIIWGTYRLAMMAVSQRYTIAMSCMVAVALLSCLEAIHGVFLYDTPRVVIFILHMFGYVAWVATATFCVAMRWFCKDAGLLKSAGSWKTTTLLSVLVHLIPFCLLRIADVIAKITGESFYIELGPFFLPYTLMYCVPFADLYVSMWRMKSEAASRSVPDWPSAVRDG